MYDIKRLFTKWKRCALVRKRLPKGSAQKKQVSEFEVNDVSEALLTEGLDQDKIFDSKMGKPLDLEFEPPNEEILRFLPTCNDIYRMKKDEPVKNK